jgi:SpoVK/Ycf46/Vps4 family AAA+-type ATPase/transcription termination factor NusB
MPLPKSLRRRKFFHSAPQPVLDASIRKDIMGYTMNLLQHLEPNERLLTLCMECLSIKSRKEIIETLFTEKEKKKCDEFGSGYYEDALGSLHNPSDLASTIMRIVLDAVQKKKWEIVRYKIFMFMKKEYKAIAQHKNELDERLAKLMEFFSLTDIDCAILKLWAIAISIPNSPLKELLSEVNYSELQKRIGIATGLSLASVKMSLSKKGLLYTSRIIESINPDGYEHIVLSDEIIEFLNDVASEDLLAKYVKIDTEPTIPLQEFSISDDDKSIVTSLLQSRKPCNILLYGTPGTGKTQFARSIAAHTHRKVFVLTYTNGRESTRHESISSRLMAITIAMKIAEKNDAILIIDEADTILNTQSFLSFFFIDSGDKGTINDLLDTSTAQCIWITNSIYGMSSSTLRRFNYSITFRHFTSAQRIVIWQRILKGSELKKYFTSTIIQELSYKYAVNAAEIANSVKTVETMITQKTISEEMIITVLERLLQRHADLSGNIHSQKINSLTPQYDLTFCNTDTNLDAVVNAIRRYYAGQCNVTNTSILLWGPSGTGKTEFVKYLANQVGKELIIKRASDLMDKYVGETEKLMRHAFEEAGTNNALLFIDEADTFFASREHAQRSWEISFINEMLVQMENFKGVLLCSTNMLELLDTAVMRRFTFKIKFNPVKPDMRIKLYERYFVGDSNPLSLPQKKRITALEGLTPGHVKAVYQKIVMMDELTNHDAIIDALEKEVQYMMKNRISKTGFAV